MMEESSEKHIRGMTHPKRIFIAANNMWKRRGAISATMKSNWVERLFVLTESSLFWFERGGEGNDGLGAQHGRVELRHIRSIVPTQTSSTSTTMDELERHGPKFCLEISHVMSEHIVLFGGMDASTIDAWQVALNSQVQAASAVDTAPSNQASLTAERSLLRLELTGVIALGILGKAREAVTGVAKDMLEHARMVKSRKKPKDGWSTRMLVLTEKNLWFYKPIKRKNPEEEDAPPFGGFGSTLRTGDYIFGREVRAQYALFIARIPHNHA